MVSSRHQFVFRPLAICAVVVVLLSSACTFFFNGGQSGPAKKHMASIEISFVPSYFSHEQQPTGPDKGFRAKTLPLLGLVDQPFPTDAAFDPEHTKTPWERFEYHVSELNAADNSTSYKVLYVARHSDGWHNAKESAVGRQEWEAHWALQSGDGEMEWEDALLTPQGERDAVAAREFWATSVKDDKVPMPQKFFSSPLRRCIQTADLTFGSLPAVKGQRQWLTVTEGLREIHGRHTCDRHGSRSEIASRFPFVQFESNFPEADVAWQPDQRETLSEAAGRMHAWLERLFREENATFISATTHAGSLRALYRAVGHPDVWSARGAVTPLMLRAQAHDKQTAA